MIAIDGHILDTGNTFPDGTPNMLNMLLLHAGQKHVDITWCFNDMGELALLGFVANHYKENYPDMELRLSMPYIPNARMDRVKNEGECFTLKWTAKMVNDMGFARVDVFDPHSDVAPALIDRCHVHGVKEEVNKAANMLIRKPDIIFYPDAGAAKRYGELIEDVPIMYGNKTRDWKTGRITGYDIMRDVNLAGAYVLIVDDISSYGGTFVHAAKALREHGADAVNLYVSHAEKSCWQGKLFDKGEGIGTLFTTDSLFTMDDVPEELRNRICFVHEFRKPECNHPTDDEMRAVVSA